MKNEDTEKNLGDKKNFMAPSPKDRSPSNQDENKSMDSD